MALKAVPSDPPWVGNGSRRGGCPVSVFVWWWSRQILSREGVRLLDITATLAPGISTFSLVARTVLEA